MFIIQDHFWNDDLYLSKVMVVYGNLMAKNLHLWRLSKVLGKWNQMIPWCTQAPDEQDSLVNLEVDGIFGLKSTWKEGFFPPLNLCRKFPPPKKASFLGCHDSWFWFFVGHISSYPWLSLILIAPFPFMKLINSLRAAKQHAAPKESWELFKVKGWLRESLGIGKKW